MSRLNYRAIFTSDVHLGTRNSQAEFLRDFLANTHCRHLYLVGDIIDLWKMRSGFYWPQLHNDILRAIMGKARNRTRVVYIPGNHDELLRDYAGTEVCGISIQHQVVHQTADRRRLLVTHGDEFDAVVRHNRWLRLVGEGTYGLILGLNRWFGHLRRRFGFPYWSLSNFLKSRVKNALEYLGKFERAVRREASRRGMDGSICGHVQQPALACVDGIWYANTGDWVENCSAVVEHASGRLEVIRWVRNSARLLDQGDDYAHRDRDRCLAPAD